MATFAHFLRQRHHRFHCLNLQSFLLIRVCIYSMQCASTSWYPPLPFTSQPPLSALLWRAGPPIGGPARSLYIRCYEDTGPSFLSQVSEYCDVYRCTSHLLGLCDVPSQLGDSSCGTVDEGRVLQLCTLRGAARLCWLVFEQAGPPSPSISQINTACRHVI